VAKWLDSGQDRRIWIQRFQDTVSWILKKNMVPIQRVLRERLIKFVEIDTNRPEDLIQEELRQIMSSASLAP
jgi:hypothetical protein